MTLSRSDEWAGAWSIYLEFNEIGCFKRREGDICWLGIEKSDRLFSIQKSLHESLAERGFKLETREYRPHITIGRRVKLKDGFDTSGLDDVVGKIAIGIDKVDLMRSEFTNGRPVYSVLYSKYLR